MLAAVDGNHQVVQTLDSGTLDNLVERVLMTSARVENYNMKAGGGANLSEVELRNAGVALTRAAGIHMGYSRACKRLL